MTIVLNERYEKIIETCVESGKFSSAAAVVEAALDQIIDPLAAFSKKQLNALIDDGVRDLNAGRILSAEQVDERLAAHRVAFLSRNNKQ